MADGARLVLSVDGDVQLDRELLRFSDRIGNASELFEALADDFLRVEARQFAGEGTYSGGWAQLAPATVRRRGSAHPILDHTGAMKRSLTVKGAPGSIRNITGESMEVGSNDPKVGRHQHGTGRMPQRRPVELSQGTRDRWVKALQRFIVTGEVDTRRDVPTD